LAMKANPGSVEAHANLGLLLAETGRFAEAVATFREAQGLVKPGDPVGSRIAQGVAWAGRLVELDSQLPAILEGKVRATAAEGWLEFAWVCKYRDRPASSARFFREAFAGKPALADDLVVGYRVQAAAAAARAGCGEGEDAASLD